MTSNSPGLSPLEEAHQIEVALNALGRGVDPAVLQRDQEILLALQIKEFIRRLPWQCHRMTAVFGVEALGIFLEHGYTALADEVRHYLLDQSSVYPYTKPQIEQMQSRPRVLPGKDGSPPALTSRTGLPVERMLGYTLEDVFRFFAESGYGGPVSTAACAGEHRGG